MKLLDRLKQLFATRPNDDDEVELKGYLCKLVVNDGDVVVVFTDRGCSIDQCARLEAYLSHKLHGAKVVVMDGGSRLGVVRFPDVVEVARGTD